MEAAKQQFFTHALDNNDVYARRYRPSPVARQWRPAPRLRALHRRAHLLIAASDGTGHFDEAFVVHIENLQPVTIIRNLTAESRLPTQADGAARSECDRASP